MASDGPSPIELFYQQQDFQSLEIGFDAFQVIYEQTQAAIQILELDKKKQAYSTKYISDCLRLTTQANSLTHDTKLDDFIFKEESIEEPAPCIVDNFVQFQKLTVIQIEKDITPVGSLNETDSFSQSKSLRKQKSNASDMPPLSASLKKAAKPGSSQIKKQITYKMTQIEEKTFTYNDNVKEQEIEFLRQRVTLKEEQDKKKAQEEAKKKKQKGQQKNPQEEILKKAHTYTTNGVPIEVKAVKAERLPKLEFQNTKCEFGNTKVQETDFNKKKKKEKGMEQKQHGAINQQHDKDIQLNLEKILKVEVNDGRLAIGDNIHPNYGVNFKEGDHVQLNGEPYLKKFQNTGEKKYTMQEYRQRFTKLEHRGMLQQANAFNQAKASARGMLSTFNQNESGAMGISKGQIEIGTEFVNSNTRFKGGRTKTPNNDYRSKIFSNQKQQHMRQEMMSGRKSNDQNIVSMQVTLNQSVTNMGGGSQTGNRTIDEFKQRHNYTAQSKASSNYKRDKVITGKEGLNQILDQVLMNQSSHTNRVEMNHNHLRKSYFDQQKLKEDSLPLFMDKRNIRSQYGARQKIKNIIDIKNTFRDSNRDVLPQPPYGKSVGHGLLSSGRAGFSINNLNLSKGDISMDQQPTV